MRSRGPRRPCRRAGARGGEFSAPRDRPASIHVSASVARGTATAPAANDVVVIVATANYPRAPGSRQMILTPGQLAQTNFLSQSNADWLERHQGLQTQILKNALGWQGGELATFHQGRRAPRSTKRPRRVRSPSGLRMKKTHPAMTTTP